MWHKQWALVVRLVLRELIWSVCKGMFCISWWIPERPTGQGEKLNMGNIWPAVKHTNTHGPLLQTVKHDRIIDLSECPVSTPKSWRTSLPVLTSLKESLMRQALFLAERMCNRVLEFHVGRGRSLSYKASASCMCRPRRSLMDYYRGTHAQVERDASTAMGARRWRMRVKVMIGKLWKPSLKLGLKGRRGFLSMVVLLKRLSLCYPFWGVTTHLRSCHHWVPEVTNHHSGLIDCLVLAVQLRERLQEEKQMRLRMLGKREGSKEGPSDQSQEEGGDRQGRVMDTLTLTI